MCCVAPSVVSRQYMRTSDRGARICRRAGTRIRHVHRHQLRQRRERGQCGHSMIVHVQAAHRQAAERRHLRQCHEPPSAEVVTAPSPDVFDRSRPAQRHEAVVTSHRVLRTQEPQVRHLRDVGHPIVFGVHAERPEMGKRDERREAGGGDSELRSSRSRAKSPSRPRRCRMPRSVNEPRSERWFGITRGPSSAMPPRRPAMI